MTKVLFQKTVFLFGGISLGGGKSVLVGAVMFDLVNSVVYSSISILGNSGSSSSLFDDL